jgi:Zn ribbon nucleic-acid-binding protein
MAVKGRKDLNLWRKAVTEEPEDVENPVPVVTTKPGRCGTCNNGDKFKLVIEQHVLIRHCIHCGEIYNPDTRKVLKPGVWEEKGNGN